MEQIDNRANILDCALQLFAARGYDAVGVQEIVDAAGITKPTLYYYFGNKHGLLEKLLTTYFDRLYKAVQPAADYKGDLPLSIAKVVEAFFIFAKENQTFYRFQLSLYFAPPESEPHKVVAELNNRQFHLIEEMFKKAASDHGNMKGRHQAYAVTFLGMINSYIAIWLNGHTQLDDALRYQAIHQFMYGIFS